MDIQTLSSKAEASKERELAEQIELMETGRESERRSLIRQLDDMRVNSAQSSEEASRVEESLRWEVSQLQKVSPSNCLTISPTALPTHSRPDKHTA